MRGRVVGNRVNGPFSRRTALVTAALLALPVAARAQASGAWTATGSTGVPDESDAVLVEFAQEGGGALLFREAAFIRDNAPAPAAVDLRYNVTAVEGLLSGGPHWALVARLRDAGGGESVVARLFRVNLNNGNTTELLTLESDLFAGAAGFRRRSTGQPPCSDPGFVFDFANNVYFVEATLTKSTGNGDPGLGGLQIRPVACRP